MTASPGAPFSGADLADEIQDRIVQAVSSHQALQLRTGGSLDFYGRTPSGTLFDLSHHKGIVDYEPSELVITARCGTRVKDLEDTLAEHGQVIPFEPPRYSDSTSIGGCIAGNLSGPARMDRGSARDFILGCRIINGKGEMLRFGGSVMKNVAGFDVSRLMCGALGTLGILLDITIKVLPKPENEKTRMISVDSIKKAITTLCAIRSRPLPLSASCLLDDTLYLRFSGTAAGVNAASDKVGGTAMPDEDARRFWNRIRDQQHPFFLTEKPIWRISMPPTGLVSGLSGASLIEWHGALRWLITDQPADTVRAAISAQGGHATAFRNHPDRDQVFTPLARPMLQVHQRLKEAFDPYGIFNPGRMYADI